ncbi:MAG: bifunctional hydroxymethylpyrimidine kinase/phosphomethylpyrimidine kinase, partial [Coriobacteriales bacterium]
GGRRFATERTVPVMRGRMIMKPSILTVAGSDSSSGAGIQMDILTAAALGVHATCAVTAVTAQNTLAVSKVVPIDPDVLASQIESVFEDIMPDAVKIGMLVNERSASAVSEKLAEHPEVPIVLDPVLSSTTGAMLTDPSIVSSLFGNLLCQATIITPNIPEAELIAHMTIEGASDIERAAKTILGYGANAVLITGGHAGGETCTDHLYMKDMEVELETPRRIGEFHGTGCSMSTAIACGLAKGMNILASVQHANMMMSEMLKHPTDMGHGSQIIDPLWNIK